MCSPVLKPAMIGSTMRAVENFQIAGNKLRLNFLVPERQHFPRFIHRRAKRGLRGDADES
jgi:hypothetical protein